MGLCSSKPQLRDLSEPLPSVTLRFSTHGLWGCHRRGGERGRPCPQLYGEPCKGHLPGQDPVTGPQPGCKGGWGILGKPQEEETWLVSNQLQFAPRSLKGGHPKDEHICISLPKTHLGTGVLDLDSKPALMSSV